MHRLKWALFLMTHGRGRTSDGSNTLMFWNFTAFPSTNRCRACSLCSIAIYTHCHVHNVLIKWWSLLSLWRSSPNYMFNFAFKLLDIFIVRDSGWAEILLLLILTVIVEYIKLPHWINAFKIDFCGSWAGWHHTLHGHLAAQLASESMRLRSRRECLIVE